jgi:error-prone DNA polymerase
MAQQLAGFPRHLSQHVGGMVISSEPLIDCVPCQPARWPNRYLAHWDKDSVDDARMVKIDFLGLGMLSVVEECVDLVERHRHRVVDLSRTPNFEDPEVYDEICRGDTVGVFQIESRAQIAMLPRTQPRSLEDLTVQVSIVRPGPIVGGAVNPYVRRREAQRRDPQFTVQMPECVRGALEETLGVVLFQDQVIEVAKQMGGFNAGEAETFRRAMSRKRSAQIMEQYRQKFMTGALMHSDVSEAEATKMFDNLLGFAEFGFPKSHGAAFGLLAYQSTWLKHYYPPEYLCALLNEQPMGFYPPHVLTKDAQRHGVDVRRPDVNLSAAQCTVEEITPEHMQTDLRGVVRVGLGYVKGVGEAGATRVEAERLRGGEYRSLFDFVQRTGLSQEATTNLIQVGAFDGLGLNRRELIWQLGLFVGGFEQAQLRRTRDRQMRLDLPTEQDQVRLADFSAYQRMASDYAVLHLSPDSHPMQFLRPSLGEGVASSLHLRSLPAGTRVDIAGLIVCRQQPLTAKGIIFLLLEDEFGLVNVLVNRDLVEAHRDVVRTAPFMRVRGLLEERAGEQRTLIAQEVEQLLPADVLEMPAGKSWG